MWICIIVHSITPKGQMMVNQFSTVQKVTSRGKFILYCIVWSSEDHLIENLHVGLCSFEFPSYIIALKGVIPVVTHWEL